MDLVNSWAKARRYLVPFTPMLKHWVSELILSKSTLKLEEPKLLQITAIFAWKQK